MPRRVLVVDPEDAFRRKACRAFQSLGHPAIGVRDPRDALNSLNRHLPDIIVVEIGTTGRGEELFSALRKDDETFHIPFLFFGRAGHPAEVTRGMPVEPAVLIRKPFTYSALREQAKTLLDRLDRIDAFGVSPEFQASFSELDLYDLLGLLERYERTGVLTLWMEDAGSSVTAAFLNGRLVSARYGSMEGRDVVTELMLWPDGRYAFRPFVEGEERALDGAIEEEAWQELSEFLHLVDRGRLNPFPLSRRRPGARRRWEPPAMLGGPGSEEPGREPEATAASAPEAAATVPEPSRVNGDARPASGKKSTRGKGGSRKAREEAASHDGEPSITMLEEPASHANESSITVLEETASHANESSITVLEEAASHANESSITVLEEPATGAAASSGPVAEEPTSHGGESSITVLEDPAHIGDPAFATPTENALHDGEPSITVLETPVAAPVDGDFRTPTEGASHGGESSITVLEQTATSAAGPTLSAWLEEDSTFIDPGFGLGSGEEPMAYGPPPRRSEEDDPVMDALLAETWDVAADPFVAGAVVPPPPGTLVDDAWSYGEYTSLLDRPEPTQIEVISRLLARRNEPPVEIEIDAQLIASRDRIRGVVQIETREGRLLATTAADELTRRHLSEMGSVLKGIFANTAREAEEPVEHVVAEFPGGYLLLMDIHGQAWLVAYASTEIRLGSLIVECQRLCARIAPAMMTGRWPMSA